MHAVIIISIYLLAILCANIYRKIKLYRMDSKYSIDYFNRNFYEVYYFVIMWFMVSSAFWLAKNIFVIFYILISGESISSTTGNHEEIASEFILSFLVFLMTFIHLVVVGKLKKVFSEL